MNKRNLAAVLYGLVGTIELGDFVAAVTSLPSESRTLQAAANLGGITPDQTTQRLMILALITFVILSLCFATAWGFYRNITPLKTVYRWAVGSVVAYSLFHFITALTLPAASYGWVMGAVYAVGAALLLVVGWRAQT
jgi:hypothetical protein